MDSHERQSQEIDPMGARSAAALHELQERAQAAMAARRERARQLESDITARFDALTVLLKQQAQGDSPSDTLPADAQAEIDRLALALEDAQAAAKLERAAWESEREALEKERVAADTERATFQAERADWETQRSAFESERAAWEAERAAAEQDRKSWDSERAEWDCERKELVARLAELEAEQRSVEAESQKSQHEILAAHDEARQQLRDLEVKLREERSEHDRIITEQAAAHAGLERERDELRQKFELALEDVQRFRARVAELEQDLARRPQANEADSAELVALRAERDALAAQVDELNRAPATRSDDDSEQQLADLRRRFELAVEDVRELKTQNAKLEAQLQATKRQAGGAADSGGMDWESQKRRMLAHLEGDGEVDDSPEAVEERTTIESTIQMTDAVVAEKDQLIAELTARLAAESSKSSPEAEREQAVNAIIDADEVIAEHRKKIAQLEQELNAKLRAAELELSVERAKIARSRAEVESQRIELEAQRRAMGTSNGPVPAGTPRRRWLSKLGLTGDDEG